MSSTHRGPTFLAVHSLYLWCNLLLHYTGSNPWERWAELNHPSAVVARLFLASHDTNLHPAPCIARSTVLIPRPSPQLDMRILVLSFTMSYSITECFSRPQTDRLPADKDDCVWQLIVHTYGGYHIGRCGFVTIMVREMLSHQRHITSTVATTWTS